MSNGPEISEQESQDEQPQGDAGGAGEARAEGDGEAQTEGDGEGQAEPLEAQEGEGQAEGSAESAPEGEAEGDDEGEGEQEPDRPGLGKSLHLDPQDLPGAIEALVLVSDKPIAPVRLARLTRSDIGDVKVALEQLREQYASRGIVLDEVAGGFQFRTHPRHAPVVRNLIQQKPVRLTRAQLEVLSIIAYRQPVTRPEIEEVRGVDSGSALKVLLERSVIRIIGKRDDAGRPMLYATTPDFLSLFGLKSLSDLPTLKEFTELSDESRDMFERRIGERPPLEGFTDDATDARTAAQREAALREQANSEPDEDTAAEPQDVEEAEAAAESQTAAEPQTDTDGEAAATAEAEPVDDGEDSRA